MPVFEQAVAVKVCASHGVAVNIATSALHIACLALGFTDHLVASANCARYCVSGVDFVDIEPATGLMSIGTLGTKLAQAERDGALPKILVPVHLTGASCDVEAITSLAVRYEFDIAAAASHSICGGATKANLWATPLRRHNGVQLPSGEGGIATTNDSVMGKRMSELLSHGITKIVKF